MAKSTTYLQMCQKARSECSIAGSGPSSVENQTGILEKLVGWVIDAWTEIQNERTDWLFMWKTFSFDTQSGKADYLVEVTDLKRWGTSEEGKPITAYLVSEGVAGEYELIYWPYDYFRSIYLRGTQTNNKPFHYTIRPDGTLLLGPTPDGVYKLQGEYFKETQILSANGDVVQLENDYVNIVKWLTVRMYAENQEDAGLYDSADSKYTRLKGQLCRKFLPKIEFGMPLA